MLEKVLNSQKIAMTYDAANELKTMTASNGTVNYDYDTNGNLTQKTLNTYTDTYTYNVKNQLTNYSGYDDYQQRYSYNARGQLTQKRTSRNAERQTLEAIAAGGGESAAAVIEDGGSDDDPDPDPYASAATNETWQITTYIYDDTAVYYEVLTETTDGITTAYEYGVERISAYTKQPLSTQKTDYIYDGRGSVAQELTYNSSWYTFGGVLSNKGVNSYTYTPFGELLTGEGSGYRFNGEYYDSATGMVNLRARQYEPGVMRFNQRDLLKGDQAAPLSLNRYLYCENDSVNFVDPSGKTLSDLWNKAKATVSNAATAVKKVATTVYNVAKTVVTSAVQQVATIVTPVVSKIVNTVKEVATVAQTQGIVAAAKTLASNAASVSAYVKNVVTETAAQREAIQASSAAVVTDTVDDMKSDLLNIAKDTYGILSPRNQEIVDNAIEKAREMQASGASQQEINEVLLGACREIAGNVGETIVDEFGKGIAALSQLGTYENPDDAALAFGKIAQPLTDASGKENMAAITKTKVLRFEDGKLVFDDAYELGGIKEGMHNNVIIPVVGAAIQNLFGAKEYYIAHTHPYCNGHQNDQFSTGLGDQAVVDQLGAKGIYLVEPTTGNIYLYDETIEDIDQLNIDIRSGAASFIGPTGYINSNYYID